MDAPSEARSTLRPRDAADVADIVRTHPRALEPVGLGSKRLIGRPVAADPLDLSALAGIVDYEPAELVLTARAGTPMAVVERALADASQRLAFDPPEVGGLWGEVRPQTLGGVVAANLAGSRRVHAGAARDHFLGFHAVDGRGVVFKAGGRVVKNVTGYDLPKLLAGSWGTLAVLTEVTVRVAPAPEAERTVLVRTRAPEASVPLMAAALGSPFEVSAAAFDPDLGRVALRLEGFAASLRARADDLLATLENPDADALEDEESRALWRDTAFPAALAGCPVVWRLSVPPSDAPRVLALLEPDRYRLDWGGGLVWAGFSEVDAARVRGALLEGHATLVKAPEEARAAVPVFHPPPPVLAAMTARVKAAFDPGEKLNPRRMSG